MTCLRRATSQAHRAAEVDCQRIDKLSDGLTQQQGRRTIMLAVASGAVVHLVFSRYVPLMVVENTLRLLLEV